MASAVPNEITLKIRRKLKIALTNQLKELADGERFVFDVYIINPISRRIVYGYDAIGVRLYAVGLRGQILFRQAGKTLVNDIFAFFKIKGAVDRKMTVPTYQRQNDVCAVFGCPQ